jgi:hypothetical protein
MHELSDPIFSMLSASTLRIVENQLSNNEGADDEALRRFFVEIGLSEMQAARALRYRSLYLQHTFLEGHTPILKGKNALRLNPKCAQFEILRT